MDMVNVIDKLESLVNTSTRVPVTHRSLVDAGKVQELVNQLRLAVPQDIKAAQEILGRKESITHQVQVEARQMRNAADEEYRSRIDDNEIVKGARKKAEEMVAEAEQKAKQMIEKAELGAKTRMTEADAYSLQALRTLEKQLTAVLGSVRKGLDVLAVKQY